MEDKNKSLWIGIGVVVILAIVFAVWRTKSGPTVSEDNTNTPGTTDTSAEDKIESTEDNGMGAATIAYADALVKYKGARLQLDKACQASPGSMTFKNGTVIMVDNRSAVNRTVKVGTSFPLKAWGFRLVKLQSSNLPATWLVDCDKSQNVATILVQK